jgi:Secretion system C-terminal sorting domain
MKNTVKPIIAALLLGSVFALNANTLPTKPTNKPYAYSVYKLNGKAAIKLAINKLNGSRLSIILKDAKGEILFEDGMYKKETYYRTEFNLESLKKGIYTLEISDGNNVEVKKIEI